MTARRSLDRRTRKLIEDTERLAAEATFLTEYVRKGIAHEGLTRSMSRRAVAIVIDLAHIDGMREAFDLIEE